MTSVLDDIVDLSQPQRVLAIASRTSSTPSLLMQQDSPVNSGDLSSDSDNEDQDTQTPASPQNPQAAVTPFAISAARNLGLSADGEKSLLRFSQLDTKSALIYQQATLIKLSETYSRLGSTMTEQGSEAGDQLVITDKIKNIIDHRIRLIILSPRLPRYRSLDKGLKTGPGAVLIEWLRSKSGINKKYFEGEVYEVLRLKVKASSRYARSDVKTMIRRSIEERFHITVLLRELTQSLEKWVKRDLKTPLAVAVRLAFLREVYQKDPSDKFWKSVNKTLVEIRQKVASSNGSVTASEILIKCLDADEQKFPPATGSALAQTVLASIRESEVQSSMDEFVAASEPTSDE